MEGAGVIIKWRTGGFKTLIERVECKSETEKTVIDAGGSRRHKISSWDRFHDSWQEAYDYLDDQLSCEVQGARKKLELANSKLGNLKGLKAQDNG